MTVTLDRPVPIDAATRPQFLIGGASLAALLSLPILLDELVPQLAAAVDGDPATMVGQR